MKTTPEQLYLDLLKKTLSFSLWPEPSLPIAMFTYAGPAGKRGVLAVAERLAAAAGLEIVKPARITAVQREQGKDWPACADTMIGLRRLDNLQFCIESVLRDGVPGDLIETGVWR